MAQGSEITAMVSSLRKLDKLRVLEVDIIDEVRPRRLCYQSYHSGDCGYLGFFQRRINLERSGQRRFGA